jgi:hypothetical protein
MAPSGTSTAGREDRDTAWGKSDAEQDERSQEVADSAEVLRMAALLSGEQTEAAALGDGGGGNDSGDDFFKDDPPSELSEGSSSGDGEQEVMLEHGPRTAALVAAHCIRKDAQQASKKRKR